MDNLLSIILPMIREIKLFDFFTDNELNQLLSDSEIEVFQAGERIVTQDDISQYLFAVLAGKAEISVTSLNENVFIRTIGKGEVFGETAIFSSEKRIANVTSIGHTTVLKIHKTSIFQFIQKCPKGGIKLLMCIISSLINKLKKANMEIAIEKQSEMNLDKIDPLIREIIEEN